MQTANPGQLNRTETIGGNRSATTVGEYIRDIRQGKTLPPIEVAKINNELYVINGHHRLEAAIRTGTTIEYKILNKSELARYNYHSDEEIINASSETSRIKLDSKVIKKAATTPSQ